MVVHTNFYETIAEAKMRLDETIVLYDGEPYHMLCVSDHKADGVFRAYLDPMCDRGQPYHRNYSVPYQYPDNGQRMDRFLETDEGKKSPLLRKMLNSPKFNKFRPFSLGMLNSGGRAIYVERSPTRHTQQGLTGSGLTALAFDLLSAPTSMRSSSGTAKVNTLTPGLYSTIVGKYPDIDLTLTQLTDDTVKNTSAAFNREFAIVRGPMGLLFLAYKGEVVGYLPYNNTSEVKIGNKYNYVKEAVDELAVFNKIS